MDKTMYPPSSAELARMRRELAPKPLEAFKAFSAAVFADGALPVGEEAPPLARTLAPPEPAAMVAVARAAGAA